jgi:hypothetical protein
VIDIWVSSSVICIVAHHSNEPEGLGCFMFR